jgi:hypothetical protein
MVDHVNDDRFIYSIGFITELSELEIAN